MSSNEIPLDEEDWPTNTIDRGKSVQTSKVTPASNGSSMREEEESSSSYKESSYDEKEDSIRKNESQIEKNSFDLRNHQSDGHLNFIEKEPIGFSRVKAFRHDDFSDEEK
jgi:hypothetical protein